MKVCFLFQKNIDLAALHFLYNGDLTVAIGWGTTKLQHVTFYGI